MYSNKYLTCLALVLESEGGNTDHPDDEGGKTGRGILQSEYDWWLRKQHIRTKMDVHKIPDEHLYAIYSDNYWRPMYAEFLPLPIAYVAFDTAVLHGVNFAKPAIQTALGVEADGIIGKKTIRAAIQNKDAIKFVQDVNALRWERMQTRKSFNTFSKGWKKRLADVEKNVIKLITEAANG